MDSNAPATKGDLATQRDELRTEMHGIRDELRGEMQAMEGRLNHAIADSANRVLGVVATTESRMMLELGRQMASYANTIIETVTYRIRATDDRYRDLPGRVSLLEDRVARLERDR